ncbi:MAG: hypothetical protein KBF93_11800 [Leptospiraceae bacterium]|nr:hypothetical protein [Leptospiraceae bacterium]
MLSITDIQKIKRESKNKLNKKDELLAILIPVKEKESLWQYAEVEVFDPTTREIIDRSSFIHVINQIITNPDYPLMSNFKHRDKKTA